MIEQSLNSRKSLPSGLTFSFKNRSRYVFGCRRWNVAALIASEGAEEAAIPQATVYIECCKSKPSRSRPRKIPRQVCTCLCDRDRLSPFRCLLRLATLRLVFDSVACQTVGICIPGVFLSHDTFAFWVYTHSVIRTHVTGTPLSTELSYPSLPTRQSLGQIPHKSNGMH